MVLASHVISASLSLYTERKCCELDLQFCITLTCGARTEKFMDLCTLLDRREFVNIILGISGYSPDPIRELTPDKRKITYFYALFNLSPHPFALSLFFFFLINIDI